MDVSKHMLTGKPILIFLAKLIAFYFLLDLIFWGYVGAADPRGGYYFPILDYFNVLTVILYFLIYPVTFLFESLGYDIYCYIDPYKNGAIIGIPDIFKLHVGFPCLGFLITIAFTSLMLAYPGRKKAIFIPLGVLFIQCINMLRILGITICMINRPPDMSAKEVAELSHAYFNIAAYVFIGLFFYWWVKRYSVETKSTSLNAESEKLKAKSEK